MDRDYRESEKLKARARRLIPGGAHTYSKGDDQFPLLSPGFIARGKGSRVWDADGNEFVDWGMGLRSVILGHAYEPVLRFVRPCLEEGSNFTRPHRLEVELAEAFAERIPSAQMVKFAKNGSDATTAAVKLARAFTGRDLVARCQEHPFFSVHDWFIGDTDCSAGVPKATQALTKRFAFNDLASLSGLLDAHAGQVACVILEPAQNEEPKAGYLEGVQALCRRHGAILIFDEMITGFRWHRRGAQALYGVTPDLSTFGKAMGNGFSVAAVVGRRDVMELGGLDHPRERVFLLSTTHGGETHSLAAAKATLDIVEREPVVEHIRRIGGALQKGFNEIARELGLEARARAGGASCSPVLWFLDEAGQASAPLRTLYLQETIRHGALLPYVAPSYSHTDADVDLTLEASRRALQVVRRAVEQRSVDGLLLGPPTKPVFRRYN